jgi:thioredoxin
MEINEIQSGDEFKNAIKEGVTLMDFNAPWCAPCHSQEPIIEKLAGKFQGKARIVAMNVDENQEVAMKLGIQGVPTLIIFKNSKEVQRFVGLQPEGILSEALEKLLR